MALKASTTLSQEEKDKISEIMSIDFMSSEDSGSDTAGNSSDTMDTGRTFIIRPLSWLSDEAKSKLASLDRKACRRKTERGKEMTVQRKMGMPSMRGAPDNCPEWAHQ